MAVCSYCIELLIPLVGPSCRYCAYPLPSAHFLVCGSCVKKTPYFDRTLIHYAFEEPLRSLLHQFKYYNGLYLRSFLSYLMSYALEDETNRPHCLIPVPMHPQRIKLRGYNQAAVLAQTLAKKLRLPYDLSSCQKVINTPPQVSLDSEQRKKNLHHAFKTKSIPYQHVAIIDDLFTTGCTANELAYSLKESGVKQVDVLCCARAVKT